MKVSFIIILYLVVCNININAQIIVSPNSNTSMLVNQFLGPGINLSGSPTKYCNSNGTGIFTNGHATSCPLDSGIILSTGYASFLDRPATFTASAGLNYGMNDPDLYSLKAQSNTDICYLQFNFIPDYDSLVFDYVFGSEEYLEWVGSVFNDVFGFFITGPNPLGGNYNNVNFAVVPTTSSIVSINSINNISNSSYYINNYPTGSVPGVNDPNFTLDGYTTKMEIALSVVAGSIYTIKMVVGDVSDPLWDSYVLLHSKSFRSFSSINLPLDNFSFSGNKINDGILLEWEAAFGEGIEGFELEHSSNGITWERIGYIQSSGNSQTIQKYDFVHQGISSNWNYYRLKILNGNNDYVYSKTIAIEYTDNINCFHLYPTYVYNNQITIQSNYPLSNNSRFSIFDALGKSVLSKKITQFVENIDVSLLKSGWYIGQFESYGISKSMKFFIR
ncbi:MAG: T9SS type A sorting domain-containing protein [Saprospiraceae bacterium]|nr:T9SS type A sorting domain-containing protein [Saprospiraceae bacterium]